MGVLKNSNILKKEQTLGVFKNSNFLKKKQILLKDVENTTKMQANSESFLLGVSVF